VSAFFGKGGPLPDLGQVGRKRPVFLVFPGQSCLQTVDVATKRLVTDLVPTILPRIGRFKSFGASVSMSSAFSDKKTDAFREGNSLKTSSFDQHPPALVAPSAEIVPSDFPCFL